MDKVLFLCKSCTALLTKPLDILIDAALLCERDNTDHVPLGFYWIAPEPDQDGGFYTEAAGRFLINIKDIMKRIFCPDNSRLNGCCGMDGCDGKNIICQCGSEICTGRSDCWQAHCIALDPECVRRVSAVPTSSIDISD